MHRYSWIKLQYIALSDNQVFSKYEAEHYQKAHTADMLISSDARLWAGVAKHNLLDNVTPTGLKNFPAEANQGHGIYVMSDEPAITVYNPKLLTASEVPTTYAALVADVKSNPTKYKLVTTSPVTNGLAYTADLGLHHILGGKMWTDFNGLASDTTVYSGSLTALQALIQGGASLAFVGDGLGQGVLPNFFKGLADFTYMKDATPLSPRGIAITAGASDPASAQLFLDWIFSLAGQDALCPAGFEATMNNFKSVKGCEASLTYLHTQVPASALYTVPFTQATITQQSSIINNFNTAFHR
jgi:iron(III) transport system substrate-binding protein